MTRLTVHEYAAELRPRSRAAKKGVKKRILDEFRQTTGVRRKAAIRLLGGPTRLGRAARRMASAEASRNRPRRHW